MNILNKLTIKHLLMNKKRTLVTIVGITLSTALMVGIGCIFSSIIDYSIREIISCSGNYHVELSNIPLEDSKYIENNHQIKNYTLYTSLGFSLLNGGKNEYKPYLYLLAVDDNYYDELTLVAGRFPKNSSEILLSEHIFTNGKVKYNLNDKITLNLGKRIIDDEELSLNELTTYYQDGEKLATFNTKTYTVVGFVERSNYEPYSFPGYTVYTKYDKKDIVSNEKLSAKILYKSPKNVVAKTNKIMANTCYKTDNFCKENYNDSLLSMYGESQFDSINRLYGGILAVVLSLITIGCTIVIYNSFAISVMERKKQFGLFSSIGATKKQLRHTVTFEAFIVGTIGILLGIFSGIIGIVLKITDSKLPEMFTEDLRLAISPLYIIIPVIYMIITILISAFIPARRASKISPIEAIRLNDDIKVSKKKIKTSFITRKIFGLEGELALKNIKRNKKKYRITIVSLVVSIVLFISFSTFLEYGTSSSSVYFQEKKYDMEIYSSDKKNFDTIVKIVDDNDYVLDCFYYSWYSSGITINPKNILNRLTNEAKNIDGPIYISKENIDNSILNLDLFILNQKNYLDFVKKSNLNVEEFSGKEVKLIAINEFIYRNYEKNIINKMKIFNGSNSFISDLDIYYHEKDSVVETTLEYKYETYLTTYVPKILENSLTTPTFIISEEMFQTILERVNNDLKGKNVDIRDLYYAALVDVPKGKAVEAEKNISKQLRGLELIDNEDYSIINYEKEQEMERNLLFVIKMFLYGFISLVTLIGVTSVLNTINTSVSLRAKEFAILRSVGLTPRGFNKMICYESIFYGLKALLYGLPLSFVVICIFHYVFGNVVSFSNMIIPYKAILIAIISVFIIVFFTMMHATRKIKKANIIDTIREENI